MDSNNTSGDGMMCGYPAYTVRDSQGKIVFVVYAFDSWRSPGYGEVLYCQHGHDYARVTYFIGAG